MELPLETQELLSSLIGTGSVPWREVEISTTRLPSAIQADAPSVLAPRTVMALSLREPARSLRTVGMTVGNEIFLHRDYLDLTTAAGLGLIVHEKVHVEQFNTIPAFLNLYQAAAQYTPESRPWENQYEYPAYIAERSLYCKLVARGMPRGAWTPLGVVLWGCP